VLQIGLAAGGLVMAGRMAAARGIGVFNENGIAISGVDPVAYFREGHAVAGSATYALKWRGVSWYFANAANLAAFEANPRQHAPQFGGYCAYGMSQGLLLATDPDAWAIRDSKLYLTVSPEMLAEWLKDPDSRILQARANWALMTTKT